MRKVRPLIVFIIFIILLFADVSYGIDADNDTEKTILIVLDNLDLEMSRKIASEDFSIGLMNSKARGPYNEESYFMTIATGRKVKLKEGEFKGLYKRSNGEIAVKGYSNIINALNNRYEDFNANIDFFGEKLKNKGVGYIGNDSSALIACDKNGIIEYGETKVLYDKEWLKKQTNTVLTRSDILVLSYDFQDIEERIELLKDYLDEFSHCNIIIFPRKVPVSMRKVVNNSLVPILYKAPGRNIGILTSLSTRRDGFITNLDIFPEILSIHGLSSKVNIGKSFRIVPDRNPLETIRDIFNRTVNLTQITYIYHGIIYFIQIYFTYFYIKNRSDKYWDIVFYFNFIIISMFVSLILGFFSLHRNVFVYLIISAMISYGVSYIFTTKKLNTAGILSTLTFILMTAGIIFYPDFIYNSYIGYDNLIAGARFYGFNNGAMAVLLASSIISYFSIKKYLPNEALEKIALIAYFALNILALSSRFGVNTGGFFTSIILFLMMVYAEFLNRKLSLKNIIILSLIGAIILFANLYIDFNSINKGHAGNLIYRIKILGLRELFDVVKIKLFDLIGLTILPPWSVVLFTQIIFMKKFWQDNNLRISSLKWKRPEIRKEYIILIITAIVAFVVNDTGVIAFNFMVQYLLVLFVNITIGQEV